MPKLKVTIVHLDDDGNETGEKQEAFGTAALAMVKGSDETKPLETEETGPGIVALSSCSGFDLLDFVQSATMLVQHAMGEVVGVSVPGVKRVAP